METTGEITTPAVKFSSSVYLALAVLKTFVKTVSGDILLEVACSLDETERAALDMVWHTSGVSQSMYTVAPGYNKPLYSGTPAITNA
jgi:hypothetical protein